MQKDRTKVTIPNISITWCKRSTSYPQHLFYPPAITRISLWAKSSQPPVLVNKVLLEHSHKHSYVYCLWLLSHCNIRVKQLRQRSCSSESLKYLLSGPLQKTNFANPCSVILEHAALSSLRGCLEQRLYFSTSLQLCHVSKDCNKM